MGQGVQRMNPSCSLGNGSSRSFPCCTTASDGQSSGPSLDNPLLHGRHRHDSAS